MNLFHSIWTLVSLLLFIGICWWAYSSARGARFKDAAHLPFLDEPMRDEPKREDDQRHG